MLPTSGARGPPVEQEPCQAAGTPATGWAGWCHQRAKWKQLGHIPVSFLSFPPSPDRTHPHPQERQQERVGRGKGE